METVTLKSRKKYQGPKNNSHATMQRLLDATGEIIHRDGLTGLKVSRIAQQAGLDKKQIYYHFGGLDSLVKTYLINQKK